MDKKYLEFLQTRLTELVSLPLDNKKLVSVDNLISRYTTELQESLLKLEEEGFNEDVCNQYFNHYIKNILSIVETLISGDQYKALRRLLLNEIHACQDIMLKGK